MAAVSDVQRLQARVEELERWVYGSGGPRGSKKVSDPVPPFWGRARAAYWHGPRERCNHSNLVAGSRSFGITKVRNLPGLIGPVGCISMEDTEGY